MMSSKQLLAYLMVEVLLTFGFLACADQAKAAEAPSISIGPSRQILPRHQEVEVYIANNAGATPLKVVATTAVADVSGGGVAFVPKELPLSITPTKFTLKDNLQRTITVKQTGPIADPLVGVVFTFDPQQGQPKASTSMPITGSVVAELTVHPEASIFQPPPPTPERGLPWYWWLVPVGAVVGTTLYRTWTRRSARMPKPPKVAKATGF